MARDLNVPPPAPPPPARFLPDSSSPAKNLEAVASFIEQRRGQAISAIEAEGILSLIHKSTPGWFSHCPTSLITDYVFSGTRKTRALPLLLHPQPRNIPAP